MSNQNSATENRMTPDEVCEKLGIKKAAYYERLRFLGIKADKDDSGKAYLNDEQFDLLKQLDAHIRATGKMDGFSSGGAIAVAASESDLTVEIPVVETDYANPDSADLDDLIRQAQELKAHHLAAPELIKLHLASQMGFEDLPEDLKQKVETVRQAATPKQNPALVASQLLAKYRSNRGGAGNQAIAP